MELLLATTNLHKIREFKDMLKSKSLSHLEVLSLHQFPDYVAPEETSLTFKGNAILKAEHAAKQLKKWTLADDSGLVVPALGGEPGIYSSRYAGSQATDADNRQKLLRAMQNLESPEERAAYFECCLALSSPDGLKKCVQGICEGFIVKEPKGRYGFGYDALFAKHDYGEKTFAELTEGVKNRISHRCKAFERMAVFLENLRD
ncbi:RdgB/HAM1 family non-canonical purine NTP pyrophosphatase [Candidatus Protochlamydia phocaeensis]|uniref:RdgB/HAM1 family non-canonical purine NTP pyrophosphatase n=1 Tax=Candidatus Protochlamydia phocaeensis TaxID=1414722 RepID=UPI000838AB67|nr:RdgB/HAM1 family non-canonical purine NTP pyrophosphatase [Candidatus Protochlamydia phocaeensis]